MRERRRPRVSPSPRERGGGEGSAKPAAAADPVPSPGPAGHPLPGGEGKAPATIAGPKAAAASGRKADVECQVVVLGSGPGGYTAAFRAADLGLATVLIERYPALGGVCLNVGCIPSKALLHAARVIDEAAHAKDIGIEFGAPKITLDKLRAYKDKVVAQMSGGLAGMAKQRKVTRVTGVGKFVSPHEIEVDGPEGRKLVRFEQRDHRGRLAGGEAARACPGTIRA